MPKDLIWIIGRGASIACGLTWTVPERITKLPRDEQIARIAECMTCQMNHASVDTTPYSKLLALLARRTTREWQHRFITTNWDFLLQRTITSLGLTRQPHWLANSHVYHVNGTVEVLRDNSQRSPFLLESDLGASRMPTPEANAAYAHMMWGDLFIVVGMSFECQVDRFLLWALRDVEDDLPVGRSIWLVVNPDERALEECCERIHAALPSAKIFPGRYGFSEWLETEPPCFMELGVFDA